MLALQIISRPGKQSAQVCWGVSASRPWERVSRVTGAAVPAHVGNQRRRERQCIN